MPVRVTGRQALRLARAITLGLGLAGSSAAAPRAAEIAPATGLHLETIATGLDDPVHLTAPPGDSRLFIVEQSGTIRIVENGRLLARPFLDISDRLSDGGERGLLSVAFHPRYVRNGYFFVNYTDRRGDTRIERYAVSPDRNRSDPSSGRLILTIRQPFANHNGGLSLFGPDGMLYIGMGDGGSGGDPFRNGQNLRTLLGKMLRIDVDHGTPYANPPDNPFVGRDDARPEIWALGLRNPWRFCFDRAESLLYIADVGQNQWEEIDVVPAGSGGLNYGWNIMEGAHCYQQLRCNRSGLVEPVVEYDHGQGCSVTGGLVYRGRRIPELAGHYFYADYCSGWIRSFRYRDGRVTDHRQWRFSEQPPVSSFGEDAEGELYVVSHNGRVMKIVKDR